MEEHITQAESAPHAWVSARSAKDKSAVSRSVSALLDALAPEQTLTRSERERARIERHRTPTGCVLQGPGAAVTVSWFADGAADTGFGELHVLVWKGVVARRGTQGHKAGATVVSTIVLRPDETRLAECIWMESDRTAFDTQQLAQRCEALLEEQLAA